MYIYIYSVYIYIYTYRPGRRWPSPAGCRAGLRKGTNGVDTNGVTAKLFVFDRDLLVLPLNVFFLKCQGVPFLVAFAAAP